MYNKNIPWKLLGFALLIILLAIAYKWAKSEDAKKEVSIGEIKNVDLGGEESYLSIVLRPKPGEALTVSGWKVSLGDSKIPFPNASALPRQGQINEEKPVVITVPTTLIISGKRSPIGVSFRENKCIGMLGYFQNFIPPLPSKCPECTEETVGYPDYNTCVQNHLRESDFFGNIWRMYLASGTDWTTSHRVVRLYDGKGKLLDTYSY